MERLHHLLVPGDYLVVAWMDLNKLKVPLGTKGFSMKKPTQIQGRRH